MSDVADTVKEETARQAVILVFGVVSLGVSLLVMDYMKDPDMLRTIKMGSLLFAKRFCQREADRWQRLSTQAATLYNLEKL